MISNNYKSQASVPQIVNIPHLVQGRDSEICRFIDFIQKSNSTRRCFQKLPPFMRRRSMSYNIYRAPRRIRSTLLKEMNKSPPKISRRKRKDRRKTFWIKRNLLFRAINHQNFCFNEYYPFKIRNITKLSFIHRKKCQKNKVEFPLNQLRWLESHLFHSKRFHMCEAFGYKLALYSTCKRNRKIYRAFRHNFLIHDSSYLQVFELSGKIQEISTLFSLCNFDLDFLFNENYFNGSSRGAGFLFQLNSEKRLQLFKKTLNLECLSLFSWERIAPIEFTWIPGCNYCNSERSIWIWIHPIASHQLFFYWESCIEQFKLEIEINLVEDINRFELIGPKSLGIFKFLVSKQFYWYLYNQLMTKSKPDKIHNIQISIPLSFKTGKKLITQDETSRNNYLNHSIELQNDSSECSFYCANYRQKLRENYHFYRKIRNEQRDTNRNSMPTGVSFIKLETDRSKKRQNIKNLLAKIKERNSKRDNQIGQKDYILMKKKDKHQTIDSKIILIFHQGNTLGFDLITPRGINSTILLRYAQLLSGQVIGIGERKLLNLEMGIPSFPFDYIETLSYQKLQITNFISSKAKDHLYACCNEVSNLRNYIRTPPSKRVNYLFNKIEFPFLVNWDKILNKHSCNVNSTFHVNTQILKRMVSITDSQFNVPKDVKNYEIFVARTGYRGSRKEFKNILEISINSKWRLHSLVLVKILSKEIVRPKSHIYMCEKEDKFTICRKNSLFEKPFKHGKTSLREYGKNEMIENPNTNCISKFETARKLVGIVTSGGYSMTIGRGFGIGYVSLDSFNKSLEQQNRKSLDFWIRYNGLCYKPVKVEQLYLECSHFKIY